MKKIDENINPAELSEEQLKAASGGTLMKTEPVVDCKHGFIDSAFTSTWACRECGRHILRAQGGRFSCCEHAVANWEALNCSNCFYNDEKTGECKRFVLSG